jgi:hypothetical protein
MTGSILLDFDCEKMCRILRLPSEKFRQDVCLAMKNNLTSVKNELGHIPDYKEIKSILISNCEDMFGTLEKSDLDSTVTDMMQEIDRKFSTEDWLLKKRKQAHHRTIKIIEGVNLSYIKHNSVELCIETINKEIRNIEIYNPKSQIYISQLNGLLIGKKFDESLILNSVNLVLN